jgi:predicted RNA-binding Zn ribbon-like protein
MSQGTRTTGHETIRAGEPGDRTPAAPRPRVVAPPRPAPGQLALVQAFVNTTDLEDQFEELRDPGSLAAWLAHHELIEQGAHARAGDLHRAIELREAIRSLLIANTGGPLDPDALAVVNRAAESAQLIPIFDGNATASLQPRTSGVDGALGKLLAIVFAAMADGSWPRLKACRYDPCRWAFYDGSKNRSGAWCSMSICGNKVKTRAYRARQGR